MPSIAARLTASLVLASGVCLPVMAQDAQAEQAPAADLPDGFDVLDRHVEAMGGVERGLALMGVRMSGTFEAPAMGIGGTVTISAAAPANQLVIVELASMGRVIQGTNGEKAWSSQPGAEPVVAPEAAAAPIIEGAQFHARYTPRDRYTSATTTGVETIEGKEYYLVELVSAGGTESVGVYSVDTGLQREDRTRATPGAPTFASVITYLDYKEFGGLKFPAKMLIANNGFEQVLVFEEIETDPEFEAGLFDAPGDL